MLFQRPISLYSLGARDYVNGLTLFEETIKEFLAHVKTLPRADLKIDLFKVTSFVRDSTQMLVSHLNDAALREHMPRASVRFDLELAGNPYRILLVPEDREGPLPNRPDYDRQVYVRQDEHRTDGTSSAVLQNIHDCYDLLRGIVEVNQRYTVLHAPHRGLPASRYWAYMTNYLCRLDASFPDAIEAEFSLKKSFQIRGRTLIVRAVRVPSHDSDIDMELCFFDDRNA